MFSSRSKNVYLKQQFFGWLTKGDKAEKLIFRKVNKLFYFTIFLFDLSQALRIHQHGS
jgi:hypothetical protein